MSKYDVFPPCCQKILEALERERRTGARNCEKGHLVSLDYAQMIMVQHAKKVAEEAAQAAADAAKK